MKAKQIKGILAVAGVALLAGLFLYLLVMWTIDIGIRSGAIQPFCNSQWHYANCK